VSCVGCFSDAFSACFEWKVQVFGPDVEGVHDGIHDCEPN